jgi:cytochrome c peroxidase
VTRAGLTAIYDRPSLSRGLAALLVAWIAALVIPLGLDLYMPVPETNPLTSEKIALGRELFFDRRLSRDQSLSCASCHAPERAFTDRAADRGRRPRADRPPQHPGPRQSRLRARILLGCASTLARGTGHQADRRSE